MHGSQPVGERKREPHLSDEGLPTHTFGVLMSLEPALAALAGLAILGQHLGPTELVAIMLVVVACAGVSWTGRGPSPREHDLSNGRAADTVVLLVRNDELADAGLGVEGGGGLFELIFAHVDEVAERASSIAHAR